MSQWPDTRILELFHIEVPVLQAPMAGASGSPMAIAVAKAGGLASLPCAMLTLDQITEEVAVFRQHAGSAPLNLNFFCHTPPDY
ncbi:2-nitropropane dioxygenase family oxidoreductase, partial [Pseudomonas syringae pv. actinidiae str. M302091]